MVNTQKIKQKICLISLLCMSLFIFSGCFFNESIYRNSEYNFSIPYDNSIWTAQENVDNFAVKFTLDSSTSSEEPEVWVGVKAENLEGKSESDILAYYSKQLADGLIVTNAANIAGTEAYWLSVSPVEATTGEQANNSEDSVLDIAYVTKGTYTYAFYFYAKNEAKHNEAEASVETLIGHFSELK